MNRASRNLIVAFDGTDNEFDDTVGSQSKPNNCLSPCIAEHQRREIMHRPGMLSLRRFLLSNRN